MDAVPLSYPHWATTVMPIPSVMYSQTHLYTVQHTIHRAKAHTLSVQHTHTPTHSRTQITCLLSAFSYRLCNDGLFSSQLNTTLGFKDIPLTVCQLWFSLPQTCSRTHTDTQGRCKEKGGGFDFVVFKNKSVGLVYLERFSISSILLYSHSRCGSALLHFSYLYPLRRNSDFSADFWVLFYAHCLDSVSRFWFFSFDQV